MTNVLTYASVSDEKQLIRRVILESWKSVLLTVILDILGVGFEGLIQTPIICKVFSQSFFTINL